MIRLQCKIYLFAAVESLTNNGMVYDQPFQIDFLRSCGREILDVVSGKYLSRLKNKASDKEERG